MTEESTALAVRPESVTVTLPEPTNPPATVEAAEEPETPRRPSRWKGIGQMAGRAAAGMAGDAYGAARTAGRGFGKALSGRARSNLGATRSYFRDRTFRAALIQLADLGWQVKDDANARHAVLAHAVRSTDYSRVAARLAKLERVAKSLGAVNYADTALADTLWLHSKFRRE